MSVDNTKGLFLVVNRKGRKNQFLTMNAKGTEIRNTVTKHAVVLAAGEDQSEKIWDKIREKNRFKDFEKLPAGDFIKVNED